MNHILETSDYDRFELLDFNRDIHSTRALEAGPGGEMMTCLFCGNPAREGRHLCSICMGLPEPEQIQQAAVALERIIVEPPVVAPVSEKPKKPGKPRKKETKPRKKRSGVRDPEKWARPAGN